MRGIDLLNSQQETKGFFYLSLSLFLSFTHSSTRIDTDNDFVHNNFAHESLYLKQQHKKLDMLSQPANDTIVFLQQCDLLLDCMRTFRFIIHEIIAYMYSLTVRNVQLFVFVISFHLRVQCFYFTSTEFANGVILCAAIECNRKFILAVNFWGKKSTTKNESHPMWFMNIFFFCSFIYPLQPESPIRSIFLLLH